MGLNSVPCCKLEGTVDNLLQRISYCYYQRLTHDYLEHYLGLQCQAGAKNSFRPSLGTEEVAEQLGPMSSLPNTE
jgi:hypothetical protein